MGGRQQRQNLEQNKKQECYSPVSEFDYDEEDGFVVIDDELRARWVRSLAPFLNISRTRLPFHVSITTTLCQHVPPAFFFLCIFFKNKSTIKLFLTLNLQTYRMKIRPNMSL